MLTKQVSHGYVGKHPTLLPSKLYFYNIEMNQVDRGDQMRAAYPIQLRQLKGWKAIFYTMVGIVVVNSYLLSSYASVPKKKKFVSYLAFRKALYKVLFSIQQVQRQ